MEVKMAIALPPPSPVWEGILWPFEESPGPEMHRLFTNEYMVKAIMGHLPVTDLKRCRLVSRNWNALSNGEITKRGRVIYFMDTYSGCEKLVKIIQLMRKSWDFPCKKFAIDIALADHKEFLFYEFFQRVAPVATYLKIYLQGPNPTRIRMDLDPESIKRWGLQTLCLDFGNAYTPDTWFIRNLQFCTNILKKAPRLKGLHMGRHATEEQVAFYVQAICYHVSAPAELRVLDLKDLKDEHFQQLLDKGVRGLKEFKLRVKGNPAFSPEALKNFLEQQAEFLQTLELIYDDLTTVVHLDFPVLYKLKTLKIQESVEPSRDRPKDFTPGILTSVVYSEQLPALRRLLISGCRAGHVESFFRTDLNPVDNIQELHLPALEHQAAQPLIEKAARLFPYLRKLGVPAHLVIVAIMVRTEEIFEHVDELTLLLYSTESKMLSSLDQILTNCSQSDFQALRGKKSFSLEQLAEVFVVPPLLQQVRVLEVLPTKWSWSTTILSDYAARLVLLNMKNLRCLDMQRFGHRAEITVTEKVMKKMKEKFAVNITRKREHFHEPFISIDPAIMIPILNIRQQHQLPFLHYPSFQNNRNW